MPVLDGLGMLKRLMVEAPTRVVMLSSRTTENARLSLDSLECGAIDFVPKPTGPQALDIGRVGDELVRKIEAAAAMPEAAFLRHRLIAVRNLTSHGRHGEGGHVDGERAARRSHGRRTTCVAGHPTCQAASPLASSRRSSARRGGVVHRRPERL